MGGREGGERYLKAVGAPNAKPSYECYVSRDVSRDAGIEHVLINKR